MNPIEHHVSLLPYNTFAIDVTAEHLAHIEKPEQLSDLVTQTQWQSTPKMILGGGSNVLFTRNLDGLIIKNNISGIELVDESKDYVWLRVGAGENWHQFVLYCIQHHYAGVENLSLIPGTVGAAPIQNIGAYGVEIQEVFEKLEAIHLQDGKTQVFSQKQCQFGYRHSAFKQDYKGQYGITHVTLRLNKKPHFNIAYGALRETLLKNNIDKEHLTIQAISDAVVAIRQSKLPDPKKIANGGSFFKNPMISHEHYLTLKNYFKDMPHFSGERNQIKISAAWLIEQCGFKGKRFDHVGVHKDQALVLVNYGGGSGMDIKNLANDIQQAVYDKFGIHLQPEVNIL